MRLLLETDAALYDSASWHSCRISPVTQNLPSTPLLRLWDPFLTADSSGDPQRHLALTTALRQTFSSPTLTTPGSPSSSRQPDPPTSCSGSLSSTTTTPSSASSSALQAEESTLDPSSPEELSKRIEEWKEIALFLRRNVVQGELKGDGSYRECLAWEWHALIPVAVLL